MKCGMFDAGGRRMRYTFDRRVILVHEVTLYELYRQTRLSDSTITNNDQFVFSHELLDGALLLATWTPVLKPFRRTFELIVYDIE